MGPRAGRELPLTTFRRRTGPVEEHIDEPATAEAGDAEYEQIEATGEPRVDEAMRRLAELGDLPVAEHPPVFERVHASLVDVLGELRPGAGDDRRALG